MMHRSLLAAVVAMTLGCDGKREQARPDPWAAPTGGATAPDPWAAPAGPASEPTREPAAEPAAEPTAEPATEPPRGQATGPLVGEWFQGSLGAEALDVAAGVWRTASGSAETWTFGADARYRHVTFRLSRLGSCTRRFLTTREGRYEIAGDVVTLSDRTGRVHAVNDCEGGYDQAASPDDSPLRFRVEPDGSLLTLIGPDGGVIADRFARRR